MLDILNWLSASLSAQAEVGKKFGGDKAKQIYGSAGLGSGLFCGSPALSMLATLLLP